MDSINEDLVNEIIIISPSTKHSKTNEFSYNDLMIERNSHFCDHKSI